MSLRGMQRLVPGMRKGPGKAFHLGNRIEHIAGDSDRQHRCGDSGQNSVQLAASSPQIVTVHGADQRQVRVGVKAVD